MKQNKSKIIGIDFSLSSPAITTYENGQYTIICFDKKLHGEKIKLNDQYTLICLKPITHEIDLIRFDMIQKALLNAIGETFINGSHIYIEGYAFGASGQLTRIAEACFCLKYNLFLKGASKDITQIAPTTLKKFATGSGRASKEDMIEEFEKDTKIDLFEVFCKKRGLKTIPAPITDIVDSYFILKFSDQI